MRVCGQHHYPARLNFIFDLTLFSLRDVLQEHDIRVIAEVTVQAKPVITGAHLVSFICAFASP